MKRRREDISDDCIFDTDDSSDDETAMASLLPTNGLSSSTSLGHVVNSLIGAEQLHHGCDSSDGHSCTAETTQDEEDMSIIEQRLRSLVSPAKESLTCDTATSPIFSYLLRTYFQMSSGALRDGQEDIVRSILQRRSTLAVLPTGWGKSLCYQLPCLVHRLLYFIDAQRLGASANQRFAIVISPLIALIADQLSSVRRQDALNAVSITSRISKETEQRVYSTLISPTAATAIDAVFMSPEAFVTKANLRRCLNECLHRVAFVCVDEAHCISEWSHDFRPTFMYLRKSIYDLAVSAGLPAPPPILALTATATDAVQNELVQMLGIEKVVNKMQPRRNLSLSRFFIGAEAGTSDFVLKLKRELHKRLMSESVVFPVLVYAASQALVDDLGTYLRHELRCSLPTVDGQSCDKGQIRVVTFHAGLPQGQRTSAQRQFMSREAHVMVATIAFGMGIDKADIRTVIHCGAPSSLAAYAQETGRAGRDGRPSQCLMICDPTEFFTLRSRALTHLLAFPVVKAIVHSIFSSPRTAKGPVALLVSAEQVAGEIGCSAESVETILYMLLLSHPAQFRSIEGKVPMCFRVVRVSQDVEKHGEEEGGVEGARNDNPNEPQSKIFAQQRQRDQGRRYGGSVQGILKQLDVVCPVEEMCHRMHATRSLANALHCANVVDMSLDDFLFRLRSLEESRAVSLRWSNYSHLVMCGSNFPCSQENTQLIVKELFQRGKARVNRNLKSLTEMFQFFENEPSQEALVRCLQSGTVDGSHNWKPPEPKISRMQAIEIAADFINENRSRIRDSFEAARALAGVAPMLSSAGPAGASAMTPLTGNWYSFHPHFGALREFDWEWILKIVSAHNLDSKV